MKVQFVIYSDTKSLLAKIDTYHGNPEKSSTMKVNKPSDGGYSLFMYCLFVITEKRHVYYNDIECMKIFFKDSKEPVIKITNFEKLKLLPLTKKKQFLM